MQTLSYAWFLPEFSTSFTKSITYLDSLIHQSKCLIYFLINILTIISFVSVRILYFQVEEKAAMHTIRLLKPYSSTFDGTLELIKRTPLSKTYQQLINVCEEFINVSISRSMPSVSDMLLMIEQTYLQPHSAFKSEHHHNAVQGEFVDILIYSRFL